MNGTGGGVSSYFLNKDWLMDFSLLIGLIIILSENFFNRSESKLVFIRRTLIINQHFFRQNIEWTKQKLLRHSYTIHNIMKMEGKKPTKRCWFWSCVQSSAKNVTRVDRILFKSIDDEQNWTKKSMPIDIFLEERSKKSVSTDKSSINQS